MTSAEDAVWIDLIPANELEPGDVTCVHHDRKAYAVYDASDGIYVTSAICTHGGANLCDGYFDDQVIECPLHQGYFDFRTGAALGAPAIQNLTTFTSRIHEGVVQIASN